MVKKIYSSTLVVLMIVGSLVCFSACGKSDSSGDTVVDSQSIYSNNDIAIDVSKMVSTDNGFDVSLDVANKTDDKITIKADTYAINGIMELDGSELMVLDVKSNKKSSYTVSLNNSKLINDGIASIRCVDIVFDVYSSVGDLLFTTDQIEIQTDDYDGVHDEIAGMDIADSNGINVDYLMLVDTTMSLMVSNTNSEFVDVHFSECVVDSANVDISTTRILSNSYAIIKFEVPSNEVKEISFNLNVKDGDKEFTMDNLKYVIE